MTLSDVQPQGDSPQPGPYFSRMVITGPGFRTLTYAYIYEVLHRRHRGRRLDRRTPVSGLISPPQPPACPPARRLWGSIAPPRVLT